MKTVSNIEEMTIEIINQFASTFKHGFEPYKYVFENDTIKINNNDGVTVLLITKESITIRDVIQDAIDDIKYQQDLQIAQVRNKALLEEFKKYNFDPLVFQVLQNNAIYISKPEPNYKTFKYFNTEEQWFQQSTVHENVLPYESSKQINKIKQAVMKDLSIQWIVYSE
ncbi:hypothetical protein GAP32_467 [Cronobacter phage vB_CsaM_GAP32]|uniref:Uncharacterized protein n=1 Tax=Cronobacter phage vB_CsaM_GAP32 TaxID=1141136 RepID=K4F9Q6_9CAUD|nr:hypothetical protein GAP32_467 [Cronobacter phage vB_CsaM_GAP32]AFC21925.1 hypothetical protein GAP32_467 [Cronobacter phage vB_CsaM_GAP32]